jgi:hypothetical protein
MILEDEKQCKQCEQVKPLSAFYKRMHHCIPCHQANQTARERQRKEREEAERRSKRAEEQRLAREARRQEFWERIEVWYTTQTEQVCVRCKKTRSARAFGTWREDHECWISDADWPFELYRTCKECRYDQCCLCLKKKYAVLGRFDGYSLDVPLGSQSITLFCQDCEPDFLALPIFRQKMLIRTCSNRTFPHGQVIYGEEDPRTKEIRYIGRTGHITRRHAEHMRNTSPGLSRVGEEGTDSYKEWYGRRTWMHDLKQLGLKPIQRILLHVDIPPQVVEWEQRYIWNGIQQGWPLTNYEIAKEDLPAKIRDSGLDFLKAPFEELVEHGFFREKGLEAFVHKWYES